MYNKHILITCPCNIITYKIAKMPIIRAFLLFYVSSYSVLCLHSKDIHISQIYQKPPLLPPRLLSISYTSLSYHGPCPSHWLTPCPSFTDHLPVTKPCQWWFIYCWIITSLCPLLQLVLLSLSIVPPLFCSLIAHFYCTLLFPYCTLLCPVVGHNLVVLSPLIKQRWCQRKILL